MLGRVPGTPDGSLMDWELEILNWFASNAHGPVLDGVMVGASALGLPLCGLVSAIAFLARRRRDAGVALAVMLLSGIVAVELQFIFFRDRPQAFMALIAQPPTPSFPSGHAATAFGFATVAHFYRFRCPKLIWAAAILIGVSRIHLGHHYPLDVAAGAVLGSSIAAIAYGSLEPQCSRARPRWAWLLWGQLAVILLASLGAYLGLTKFPAHQIHGMDKVMHFILFGLGAFFLTGWFVDVRSRTTLTLFGAVAVVDEVSQAFSPVRTFDWGDMVCTLAGIAILGGLGAWMVGRRGAVAGQPRTEAVAVPTSIADG